MFNLIADAIFAFNWDRFTRPGVLSGIAIMVVGMIFLITAPKISDFIIKTSNKKGKNVKDTTFIFKIVAGVLVLTGALLAILTL